MIMFVEGSENILAELHENLSDDGKWLSVAKLQPSSQTQIEILSRAVATVPSSLSLWQELITLKMENGDSQNLPEILRNALNLFPNNIDLWNLMFRVHPAIETYLTALTNLNKDLVWPRFIEFLISGNVTEPERLQFCQDYLNEYPQQGQQLISALIQHNHIKLATSLLLKDNHCSSETWLAVVERNPEDHELLERALKLFPEHEGYFVPLLAQQKLATQGFSDARHLLLQHLEHATSVDSFCKLFAFITQFYELRINGSMRTDGQGGWKTAQSLTELGNIIKKRPNLISKIALKESPNNVGLWLDRAKIWETRPYMAADIIETAFQTINPNEAYNGDLTDLRVLYARLQIQNGNQIKDVCEGLENILARNSVLPRERTKLSIAIADIYQGPGKDTSKALEVIKTTLKDKPKDKMLWMHYLSVLAETKSPDLMEAFSSCCMRNIVTMRMVLLSAQAFPNGSSDQIAVFEKGLSMFPPQISLPLWRHYLVIVHEFLGIFKVREAFSQAFRTFANYKKSCEELALLYISAERNQPNGSNIMARKALQDLMPRSNNYELWAAFISTYEGDADAQRQAFEAAINRLDDKEANMMALKMAEFENSLGETQRSNMLLQYASMLQSKSQSHTSHNTFDERHRATDMGLKSVRFVPAVEMES